MTTSIQDRALDREGHDSFTSALLLRVHCVPQRFENGMLGLVRFLAAVAAVEVTQRRAIRRAIEQLR